MSPASLRRAGLTYGLWLVASCTGRNPAFQPPVGERDAAVDQANPADLASGGGDGDDHKPSGGSGGAGGAGVAGAGGAGGEPFDAAAAPDEAALTPDVAAEVPVGPADAAMDASQDGPLDVGAGGGDGTVTAGGCPPSGPAGWACISPGSFTMGSTAASDPGRDGDETAHPVTITRPFWMKATEVTQGEWQLVMGANPSNDDECGSSCPVENVNWYQAIAFANASSLRDGYPPCYERPGGGIYDAAAAGRGEIPRWPAGLACPGYRLPTEAEWEYAARAGSTTAFHGGPITRGTDCSALEPALDRLGWYCGNSDNDLQPVGRKQPNAWGLYDMHGNVWEWLWDMATSGVDYPAGAATDPLGPSSGSRRRDRGGSYHNHPAHCRAANRDSLTPDTSFPDTGLRTARSAL